MFTPASTTHYVDEYFDHQSIDRQKVYTPAILLAFLILMRLLGFPIRAVKNAHSVKPERYRKT
jgi:hypothetical protein